MTIRTESKSAGGFIFGQRSTNGLLVLQPHRQIEIFPGHYHWLAISHRAKGYSESPPSIRRGHDTTVPVGFQGSMGSRFCTESQFLFHLDWARERPAYD